MLGRTIKLHKPKVLIVDDTLAMPSSVGGRAVRALSEELESRGIEVVEAVTYQDGRAAIVSDPSLDAILLDWTREREEGLSEEDGMDLLRTIRARNAEIPVILMEDRTSGEDLTVEVMQLANEYVWMLEDTTSFIAGRIMAAVKRYREDLLPPFTKALLDYADTAEYSWAAPGHQGGVAFTKTPSGRAFFDFFGENIFRTDTGIEREQLGSLMDHSGPIGEAEQYAARVFGAHLSYSGLTGTSGSNRAIMGALVADNEFALCDRNCHKSIEQGLIQSGGIPLFFVPTRNRYGIIGPIPPEQLEPETIAERLAAHPLRHLASDDEPVYAVVTNCTYDGLCYDAAGVERRLDGTVNRIHFDEAWFGYARFNPLYDERYAMRGDPADHPAHGPTVFATHSTHKLLAALSQASYIHVRNGRDPIEHTRFNEAYMAQTTTSPLYALIASNEIGAAMMDGPSGHALTHEVILEAIAFRQALARAHRAFEARGDWFFRPWNAPTVRGEDGTVVPFEEAPPEFLATDAEAWILHPGDAWHGFDGLPDGWCMLDPIKAGILTPGMGDDGEFEETGIPAEVLSAYLHNYGIIPSRTTDFMVLCLFSFGITKGKWGTLMSTLLDFKLDYDGNKPLKQTLPHIVAEAPKRYAGMGLKDLCDEMFAHMRATRIDRRQALAFSTLPEPRMPPRRASARLMAGKAELLPIDALADRVAGVGVIPYPPGIPIIMPGESFGPADGPWLSYLRALESWGRAFPGFAKELEGSVVEDGNYRVWCLS